MPGRRRCYGRLISRTDTNRFPFNHWRSFRHWLVRYRDFRDGAIALRIVRHALIFSAAVFGRNRHPAQPRAVIGVSGANRLLDRNIAVGIEHFLTDHERAERDKRDQRPPAIVNEDIAAAAINPDTTPSVSVGKFTVSSSFGQAGLAKLAGSSGQAGLTSSLPGPCVGGPVFAEFAGALRQAGLAGLRAGDRSLAGLADGALRQAGFAGLRAGDRSLAGLRAGDGSLASAYLIVPDLIVPDLIVPDLIVLSLT